MSAVSGFRCGPRRPAGCAAWVVRRGSGVGPFRIESLRPAAAGPLAQLAARYGDQWVRERLDLWADGRPSHEAGPDRFPWVRSLPELTQALQAWGPHGAAAAHHLLALTWRALAATLDRALADSRPSHRNRRLGELAPQLTAVLAATATATATAAAGDVREDGLGFCRGRGDPLVACLVPALRAAAALPAGVRRAGGFGVLAADCAALLQARLDRPPRADDDWSIPLPGGCDCELCEALGSFLADRDRRTLEWPLAENGRRHVHRRIDVAELPVRHETRRQGRPYTLVVTKTPGLFDREAQARDRDREDRGRVVSDWSL